MAIKRFQNVRASDAARRTNDELREAYSNLYELVKDSCPDSERRRTALQEIESSFMWATKCVSRATSCDTEDARGSCHTNN